MLKSGRAELVKFGYFGAFLAFFQLFQSSQKTTAELGTVLKSGRDELVRGLACDLSDLNRSNSGGFWIFLKFI